MAKEYIDNGQNQFYVGQDAPGGGAAPAPMAPMPAVNPGGTPTATVPAPKPRVNLTGSTPLSTNNLTTLPTPKLPTPTAPNVMDEYVTSMSGTIQGQRKTLEDRYKRELDDVKVQQEESQKKIDEFNKKQEGLLDDAKDLTDPFRNELENNERNRLHVNENFEANQKLVGELERLLTQSSNMMSQLRNSRIPGLAGISQSPRAMQAMEDVSARVGVIQGVMSARSGQISEAYNMIDRSVSAINADRKDQLNYYSSLVDFYENQKDTEGNKLIELNKEEKAWIDSQVGLLEGDLERSQATSDYIKELMINPETAKFMADAGVTLNDSVESIQNKMAVQTEIKQRQEEAKVNQKEAFDAGITSEFYDKGGTIVRTSDGWGFKDPEEFLKMTGMTIEQAQAKGMIENYDVYSNIEREQIIGLMGAFPDAGIRPTDSLETAEMKLDQSRIYQESVRPPSSGSGRGGSFKDSDLEDYIKDLAAENGGITDENRYELWDMVASKLGDNATEYNDILWEYFHPEGAKGYKKYVLGQDGEGDDEDIF